MLIKDEEEDKKFNFNVSWNLWQLGPFIDSDHPEIKKGSVHLTFDEMFHLQILGKVYKLKKLYVCNNIDLFISLSSLSLSLVYVASRLRWIYGFHSTRDSDAISPGC